MMAGVTTVSAQDEGWKDPEQWVEVTADMWHQWGSEADPTHCKKDAVITGDMTPAWNLNSDIGAGACVLGAENVTWNLYADITEYEKLIIHTADEAAASLISESNPRFVERMYKK